MKTPTLNPFVICAPIVAVCLTVNSLAQPPRPGGPGGPGRPGGPGAMPPPVAGDMTILGPMVDKFHGFQRAQLHGEKFYTKEDAELQKMHASVYQLITEQLITDKITEAQGESFVTKLIAVGAAHQAAKAGGTTPTTTTSLHDMHEEVKAAARQEVKEEELTPDVNRVQLLMGELARFTNADKKLSPKSSAIQRRLDGFITKESRAKEDRNVEDREREKLAQESTQAWGEVLQILKR